MHSIEVSGLIGIALLCFTSAMFEVFSPIRDRIVLMLIAMLSFVLSLATILIR